MKKYLYQRVMIIDDNKLDRYISSTTIKRDSFAEEITEFNSAVSALKHLISIVDLPNAFPQVIFLDINMPVMDGFGFLDNYMNTPEFVQKKCNIIMISSTNTHEDFEKINTYSPVCIFFQKPLSQRILFSIRNNLKDNVAI